MDTKITEIEILLDKLNLLFTSVKNDGEIDKVEMELLKKYTQQLYDKVHGVSNQKMPEPVKIPVVKTEVPEPIIEKIEKPVEHIIPPVEKPMPEIKPIEKHIPEIIEQIKITPEVIEPPVVKKEIPPVEEIVVPPVVKVEEKPIIKKEEPVVEQKQTVQPPVSGNEKKPFVRVSDDEDEEAGSGLSNKLNRDKKTLADKLTSSKGKDLKSIIDLNEKLYFVSKMFKGDKEGYEHAIKSINNMQDVAEFNRYLQSTLIPKYQWTDEEAIERFTEVIHQKFV